jgi:hypothetical protein
MKLRLILTKWLINHATPAGCPYIYLWGIGRMHLEGTTPRVNPNPITVH